MSVFVHVERVCSSQRPDRSLRFSVNEMGSPPTPPTTTGRVIHWAARYDLLAWLLTRGKERAFRERLVALAQIKPGESVLDIGCGTGTLAITAKHHVGPTGEVFGIDASPRMIARAVSKASAAGLDVSFSNAVAEALPFSAQRFDVVLSTLMLHHLPRVVRLQCAQEVRRVLKRDGRVLVVDFSQPQSKRGLLAYFHRHGHVSIADVQALLEEVGLPSIESGPVGVGSLHYVLATVPA
jgi:SAM-dependent methyltransferase